MKTTTKTAAAVLAGTMALTCASCGLLPIGGAKPEEIVDAADVFAKALVSCDTDDIAKLTNEEKDSDTLEELEANLNGLLYSPEQDEIAQAIAKTITYEIDEESVKIDKEEASVDVTFTMVDYEAALGDGKFADVDEAVAAIKDCDDTSETEITFEFEKDEDEWLISNLGDKAFGKFYSFYGLEVEFTPDFEILTSYADHDDYNTTVVMTVAFSEDVVDYADGFTFDVYCDDVLEYIDMEPDVYDEYVSCYIYVPDELEPGVYTLTLKYNGEELVSEATEIESAVIDTDPINGVPDITGDEYTCYVDCTDSFESMLTEEGFDLSFSGSIGLTLELTLSDDDQYLLKLDGDVFTADLIDFFTDNKDELMMAFLGVTSEDELEAYAESLGDDSYKLLEDTMVQACVSEYCTYLDEFCDYGTYEYSADGSKIYFYSEAFSNFDGEISGNTITIDPGDTSLNDGEPMEFVLAG